MSTIINGNGITTNQIDSTIINQNGINVADDNELSGVNATATSKATLAEVQAYDLGVGQTWQDVTASRSARVTYTNTTGKPIMVFLGTGETRSSTNGYNSIAVIYVDNIIVASATNNNLNVASGGVPVSSAQTIVPSGSTYKFDWEVGYDDGVLLITELR